MSEMIERCAVAIDRLRQLKGPPSHFDVRWAVREILGELRVPTEAMIEASNREWDGRMSHRSSGAWLAMIDTALTAPEPGK